MATTKQKIRTALGLGIGIPLVAVGIVLGVEYNPKDVENMEIYNNLWGEKAIRKNIPVSLLSWNIQYAASRKHHFFYDGGMAVHAPTEDVVATIQSIVDVLQKDSPDILAIQEIDRNSDRTQNIDQLDYFRDYRDHISWTAAPYHKVPYVPHPNHKHLGRMDMNLAIFSRFPLYNAKRYQLALLQEPRWRQYFNLKRALLVCEIAIENSPYPLLVATTHLSAFSHGDGTLPKQMAQIQQWIQSIPAEQPWILAGDFNLLPPEDLPERLGEDAQLYVDSVNPLIEFFSLYKEAFRDTLAEKNRTYLPFGAKEPDRKIDYVFYGGPIEIQGAVVIRDAKEISDHLPLKIKFVITDSVTK